MSVLRSSSYTFLYCIPSLNSLMCGFPNQDVTIYIGISNNSDIKNDMLINMWGYCR